MGGRVLFQDTQRREQLELNPAAPTLIGRGFECAVRTDDHMVSRLHAEIRLEGGRYVVEDKGSSNGTLVNGTRVQKHVLNHNDVVQCGTLWLQYMEELPL